MKIKNFKKITAMACACAVVTTAGILPARSVYAGRPAGELHPNHYTSEAPFEFPTDGTTTTLEAEYATSYSYVSNSGYPPYLETNFPGASGEMLYNLCQKNGNNYQNDYAEYAYNAEKAGTYLATVYYNSGSLQNEFTISGAKIRSKTVVAGADDRAAALHSVTFSFDINEAGAGTLRITAGSAAGAPRLDKFDIKLVGTEQYSESNPFQFPTEKGTDVTVVPEKGSIENNTSGDGGWPARVTYDKWSDVEWSGLHIEALNANDKFKVPYTADKVGKYQFTVTYRSGNAHNGFVWSEESGKIADGTATAGSGSSSVTKTATFNVDVKEAGAGVLVFSGAANYGAPNTAKFDVQLLVDKSDLVNAIAAAKEKLTDGNSYTTATTEALQAKIAEATTVKDDADATQETVDAAVTALNEAKDALAEVAVVSIAVTTQPTKRTYERGETFDKTGLEVTAYDNNGDSKVVTDYTVSELDSETAGTKEITVTYKNLTTTFEVTVNESYVVKVDGQIVTRGQYNDLVTITAAEKVGKTFTGWRDASGKVVSTKATYSFRLTGDRTFTSVYDEKVEVEAQAKMNNAYVASKNADGSGNVRFMGQIVVPKGYRVEECGVIWTGRNTTNMPDLYTLDGNTFTAVGKKVAVKKYTCNYQFGVAVNNVPAGKTARGVVYAKLTNGTDTMYVFSEENRVTVK